MATSSFTTRFELQDNEKSINSFIELMEKTNKIKIECNNLSSDEEKINKENLFNILRSIK